MNVLGIIAARGGSKRLRGKNVMPLAGRPLIDWTVRAALDSGELDRLIVSTDSPEIAAAAVQGGAEIPFERPAHLATDEASGTDVILHALEFVEAEGNSPEWILCLQATSPLRTAEDIREMFALARRERWREGASFRPARPETLHPWRISRNGSATPAGADPLLDGEWLGELNGAMYLIERDLFVERRGFFTEHLRAFHMTAERSVDIDTAADFAAAEAIISAGTAS